MSWSNLVKNATDEIEGMLRSALAKAMEKGELCQAEVPTFSVEIPADTSHGDFASNVAMVSARSFKLPPIKIAQILLANCTPQEARYVDKIEIAGPGFLNFFLRPTWFIDVLRGIQEDKENYGRSSFGNGEKVNVEFVSANPTGPMHMGNARGGAIGDVLAAAMDWAGFDVTREFYINDAGNQIQRFGTSLSVRYLQIFKGEENVELPEECYQGEDIKEHAQAYANLFGDKLLDVSPEERSKALVAYALPLNVANLKADLEKYGIHYDVWFRESTLHESNAVSTVVELLTNKGLTYEKEGAIWYKATAFGCEKDDVLVRANGIPTYFTADIAYHYNKFVTRGFGRAIDVWGADHHGHVARLKGAMDAIGLDGSKLDIVLMQLVRLMKDGQPYKMSKRSGKSITLTDLIEEIPIDAARFFFNMREPNSALDFDLDLAVEETSQNPVYYVQYAHARICSIQKNLAAEGTHMRPCTNDELALLNTPDELALIRALAAYPQEIVSAAKNYDPARLTKYTTELATLFHKFYTTCRIKGEQPPLMQARLALADAVKNTLKNAFLLLKISAPLSM